MANADLDNMIACEVIPSSELFYKCQRLMGHKEETGKTSDEVAGSLGRLSID